MSADHKPEILTVPAHELRTGDLLEEGRMILSVEGQGELDGPMEVFIDIATPRLAPPPTCIAITNLVFQVMAWDDTIRIVRWTHLPDGGHPVIMDIYGNEICWRDGPHAPYCPLAAMQPTNIFCHHRPV